MYRNLLFVLIFIFSSCVAAQEQMTPEKMQEIMQQQSQMMIPLFGQMMRVAMETQFEILSKPETAKALAEYTRNYYNELIEAGFTRDQALEIAMNVGIPASPMMGQ